MKPNRIDNPERRQRIRRAFSAVLSLAVLVALVVAYVKFRDLWIEQCEITDFGAQVKIASGRMVKADVIAEKLGLKEGANLATIDFRAKREELLKSIPNLRDVVIRRRMPGGVEITIEERVPAVKLNQPGRRQVSGYVADAEGVVFLSQRGTQALPTIREPAAPLTAPGKTLKGRSYAALKLLELCESEEFSELGVQEADVSKPDYVNLVLGDYSQARIAWDGWEKMENASAATKAAMRSQLTNLRNAIRTKVGQGALIWNATQPGRVYADSRRGANR